MKHFNCPTAVYMTLENRKICLNPKMLSVFLNLKGIQNIFLSPIPGALGERQRVKSSIFTLQKEKNKV